MNLDILKIALTLDEGKRAKPYTDTVGKLTIGIGHNLTDKGLSGAIIDAIFAEDIGECVTDLRTFPWFDALDEVRQHVVLNMRFQLGPAGFRAFKQTIANIAAKDYDAAADAMRASKWASQVPARAGRLINEMRTGQAGVANA